jgi:hypothetical protein
MRSVQIALTLQLALRRVDLSTGATNASQATHAGSRRVGSDTLADRRPEAIILSTRQRSVDEGKLWSEVNHAFIHQGSDSPMIRMSGAIPDFTEALRLGIQMHRGD